MIERTCYTCRYCFSGLRCAQTCHTDADWSSLSGWSPATGDEMPPVRQSIFRRQPVIIVQGRAA